MNGGSALAAEVIFLTSPSFRPLAALAVLMVAALPLLQAQEGPVSLQLRWQPGKTYTQETTTETTTALSAVGKGQDVKMKVVQITTIQVTGRDDGGKDARVTFDSLRGEVLLEGKTHTFDSKDLSQAHPMIRSSIGRSVGKSFVLAYDKNDQFEEVKDTGAMAPAPLGMPELQDLAEAREVAELFRRSLEMGLPQTRVKPGDRWVSQQTVKFPSAGTVHVELRVKFEALVEYDIGPHAKISFEGEMTNEADSSESRPVSLAKGSKTFGQVLFDLTHDTISFAAFRGDLILDVQGKKLPIRQQVSTKLLKME